MTATTGEGGTAPAARPAYGEHPPTRRDRPYALLGADGRPYRSETPGTLAGHRRGRLYGRLDCPSACRAIAAGGYVRHRVFFADEQTAIAAGYRPCAVCLPAAYRRWKASRQPEHPHRRRPS
ncbi:metal-binding protein [Kitasatospora sp. CM 4170]|uniref:Metal-binding protein n=1 Tax=Kitasatospora aburaviensis TaxID=67265 RepID=A0ABW1EX30_9ACTN|nr:metal-binding protein [Kitasatospora sp. CM 4170]WNM43833.1 metal-binding protein [Kitasatospora sp. CM 4170]